MNTVNKIKARLRNTAIKATIFDSTKREDEQKQFVLLEDAIKAIDDFELLMTSPPCVNFTKKRNNDDNRGQEISA